MERAKGDPFALADTPYFPAYAPRLPPCCAKRFCAYKGGQAALLPRMQSIGDTDEEELYFAPRPPIQSHNPPGHRTPAAATTARRVSSPRDDTEYGL